MPATIRRTKLSIPTYMPDKPHELPFFLEKKPYQGATGRVYPIAYTDRLSNEAVEHIYNTVVLENEHICVTLLPELGGKVHGAVDKHNGYEFVYQNTVVKPAMVGLAGPWVSGGIEFNWPQHHRPTTFMPLEATIRENADGSKTCWMGEGEPFHRMRGAVGITVFPDCSYFEGKAVVYNRTSEPLPFMWWNNLAVRVHSRYKATFPPDVEYVNDHDRRAVISFPVMKGVYHTARPFDYGKGTDATWFSNVKLPTSVMVARGQSDMDFLGGYDFDADAGTVTVSDHGTSVGKKMWTWGDGPFGRAWCANLTDNGDRYIELMTGVYTDNQPDFTYIMPGETKTFTQVWYPIHDIGEVCNATREAAVSLVIKDGKAKVGAEVTSAKKAATLKLFRGDALLGETKSDLTPEDFITLECILPDDVREEELTAVLVADGRELVTYTPVVRGKRVPPKARTIPPRPSDVTSVEELYLHGAHLRQYKHHTFEAEDYFREGLHREPDDLRINTAMGQLLMDKGDYDGARECLARAIRRLKMRNDNPSEAEAIYTLGRLERLCGNTDAAYRAFRDAAWQYQWRSASYYEMACIECMRGEREQAKNTLRLALRTNADHFSVRVLLGYLEKDELALEAVLREAVQDVYARFALWLINGRPVEDYILNRAEDVLDAALDFAHAGLNDEAVRALNLCKKPSQLTLYHLSRLTGEAPEHMPLGTCFPNRLEDIAALDVDQWQGQYLLGCLYYDRGNIAAARVAWERSRALNPNWAFTNRNLAQLYFDHLHMPDHALSSMRRALELAPDDARILYELLQLQRNMRFSVKERLMLLENHAELTRKRDDCYLEWIILYTQDGQYKRARELLLSKRFNIYEGGEGKLTRHHGWLYTLMGREAQLNDKPDEAAQWLQTALVYPDNYGEGRHYSAQEANIYYFTGLLKQSQSDMESAREAWLKAVEQPGQITEMSYFAALSARKLGFEEQADAICRAMLDAGHDKMQNSDRYGYFGVGMAAPLPFELDIRRMNTIDACLLIALGAKGLGKDGESERALALLTEIDPYNSKLDFIRKLDIL